MEKKREREIDQKQRFIRNEKKKKKKRINFVVVDVSLMLSFDQVVQGI
jgi:hypothetical protein